MLVDAVKTAVAKYGVDYASTRNIAALAGVDDGHIYRFFKTRDELLLQAYITESNRFIDPIITEIEYLHNGTRLHLEDCAELIFHKAWTYLMDNPDYCCFAVCYYHSPDFQIALDFHHQQLAKLTECMKWLFDSEEETVSCMYVLLSTAYDFGKQVIDGRLPNTVETEDSVSKIFYSILYNQSSRGKNK